MIPADFMVLAETTAQGTTTKKDSAAAICAADTGFFPVMKGSLGRYDSGWRTTVAGEQSPVDTAHSGAELAVGIRVYIRNIKQKNVLLLSCCCNREILNISIREKKQESKSEIGEKGEEKRFWE